ncbi:MAG: EAL domain-containing protein [Desulfobacterales bacterium]|nr:EAL domain-containing protein [Desulfobacterales bacterium]
MTGSQIDPKINIHEGFFYNEYLGLPTVVREYEKIEKILIESHYLACITVQVEQLSKIEYIYGSNIYHALLNRITDRLRDIKNKSFRGKDIFVVDFHDPDTFVLFLSSPRRYKTQLLSHLDSISERIRLSLEKEIFQLIYPYLKEYIRPVIGYAMEIQNPMVNNMRIVMRLIRNSKKMAEYSSIKRNYESKFELQKLILEQDVLTLYQPIIDMQTLDVLGYEALTRGPENSGFSDPLMLFMLAQECGLSFELDRLCRKKAFERIPQLATDKKIFINTLSMTIHDPQFRGLYLKELLDDLAIKPENVIFEISEKLAIDNYDIFRAALKDYTDIGIVHAGDDIGTGYSDMERIMELNPGYLKIDMSFIRGIDTNYIKQEIVKAMSNLSSKIGSQIIVEGIETKEEYKELKKLGIKYGQGYLFAKPSEKLEPINTNILNI